MKFALNGALTIGTLDGANIEIMEEVGKDNIFIFGLTAEEAAGLRSSGYNSRDYHDRSPELKKALQMISDGTFSSGGKELFKPIIDSLLNHGDYYLLMADYESYVAAQERVSETFRNRENWTRKCILNVAGMGKFSTDRTIREYAGDIWGVKPVPVK
jgi:starch phosphorylase